MYLFINELISSNVHIYTCEEIHGDIYILFAVSL